MSDWVNNLAVALKNAVNKPDNSTIIVQNSLQKALAERALVKMAPDRTNIQVKIKEDVL